MCLCVWLYEFVFFCLWVCVDVYIVGAFSSVCILGRKLSDHLLQLRIMGYKSLLFSLRHEALSVTFPIMQLHRQTEKVK